MQKGLKILQDNYCKSGYSALLLIASQPQCRILFQLSKAALIIVMKTQISGHLPFVCLLPPVGVRLTVKLSLLPIMQGNAS